jgi:hypothetical protein
VRGALLVALLVALPLVSAQGHPATQPLVPPDWSRYAVRDDLAQPGSLDGAVRILRFVQVSDAHILDDDAPHPLRVEALDPFGPPFTAAQRPQDEYTDEVLDATVRAINALHGGDALQFILNTGDNIDNDLENELMRFLDLYRGTVTTTGPLSGLACVPDGQSASIDDASNDVVDACTSLPADLAATVRGLAPGLPWYSAFGNHDALIQGNVNIAPSFQDIAAQSGRRFLQQSEYVAMHFPAARPCPGAPAGSPADFFGNGYGFAGPRLCDADPDNDGYYAFSVGGVRFVVLDTVNDDFVTANGFWPGAFNPQTMVGADVIGGYAEGAIDPVQWAWVEQELATHASELVVLVSHHTANSMFTNLAEGYCAPGLGCLHDLLQAAGYRTGPQLVADLAAYPNVAAWIGGHTHRHRVEAKTGGDGGFWNIESSSLIDWPQEARVVELWATADGAKGFWRLTSFKHDFQPSIDLEATDPQRELAGAGEDGDRDVLLWFDMPPGVVLTALPEPAHQWRIRVEDPARIAQVGQPFEARLVVDDLLNPGVPLPRGLQATWQVYHSPTKDGRQVAATRSLDASPLSLDLRGDKAFLSGAFTPVDDATHYATVTLLRDGLVVAQQVVSFPVSPSPATPDERGSPALPFGLLLLGLAWAVAARRR